ncbi:hypothetical protein G7Y89_g15492 [Cudoniella acicularis]|uniref:Heterokaryon incompatibility domain-containing protein n=1 Tax=Cudoniella acicularis TaxID=354080 RepID=A0A8H4VKM7_9HELO|nr:hypothetical protein G7Y89_g15492 [Cudoniella acicularis]
MGIVTLVESKGSITILRTRSSKLAPSNRVLDALSYTYDVEFAVYCDPAEEFGVKTRKVLTNTSSEQSFETAASWLEDCILHYPCGQNVSDQERNADNTEGDTFQHIIIEHYKVKGLDILSLDEVEANFSEPLSSNHPSRLVDLLPHGPESIDTRLVGVAGNCGLYAALSYCWDPDSAKDYMLTEAALPKFSTNIPSETLPHTIQEASQISRHLGVRYIWIDALCIIQGDDKDW